MLESDLAQVTCPGCRGLFFVANGAAEARCSYCGQHIVWRECLDRSEIFPVLSSWPSWVHPNCASVHAVALGEPDEREPSVVVDGAGYPDAAMSSDGPVGTDVPVSGSILDLSASAGDDSSAQVDLERVVLAEHMTWTERNVAGQLVLDARQITITPKDAPEVLVATLVDVIDFEVVQEPDATPERSPKKPKRFRRGLSVGDGSEHPTARLSLAAQSGSATLRGPADAGVLTDLLTHYVERQHAAASAEVVQERIRKLAELAVLGVISADEFVAKKEALLARLR
ncbi:MAG: SHOCT domain-containing protein [Jatrophihabitans sp.]